MESKYKNKSKQNGRSRSFPDALRTILVVRFAGRTSLKEFAAQWLFQITSCITAPVRWTLVPTDRRRWSRLEQTQHNAYRSLGLRLANCVSSKRKEEEELARILNSKSEWARLYIYFRFPFRPSCGTTTVIWRDTVIWRGTVIWYDPVVWRDTVVWRDPVIWYAPVRPIACLARLSSWSMTQVT